MTWDERKRAANLRRHGLDFEGCESVFGRVVQLIYTEREEDLHVISLREATKHEARIYFEVLSSEP